MEETDVLTLDTELERKRIPHQIKGESLLSAII